MSAFILRRLLLAIPTLFGVLVVAFLVLQVAPGDPVQAMVGEHADSATVARLRTQLHLDEPLVKHFGIYVGDIAKGDLGRSYITDRPISRDIKERFPKTLTLAMRSIAFLARMTRSAMLDALNADFIRTARAKGLREGMITLRHGFRNALIPVITVLGLDFGAYLTGSILTETIFGWPGIGRYVVNAISRRDLPAIQGSVLFLSTVFVLVNL